jgi:hypothetical protein
MTSGFIMSGTARKLFFVIHFTGILEDIFSSYTLKCQNTEQIQARKGEHVAPTNP